LHCFSNRFRIGEKNKVRASSARRINKLYQTLMPAADDDERSEYIDAA
jgi:hypothetical protein